MPHLVPKSAHFYMPVILMLGLIAGFIFLEKGPFYEWLMSSEFSITENLTLIFGALTFIASFLCLKHVHKMENAKFFKAWFILFGIGNIYLFGEEASWGQHIFAWESPAYFIEHNQMNETNLHNLTPEMEQIPKILLHLAALVAVIWVIVSKVKNISLKKGSFFYWVMPNSAVVTSVVMAFACRLWERYYAWQKIRPEYAERDAFKELKEANETFLVLFMMFYVLSILYRLRATK